MEHDLKPVRGNQGVRRQFHRERSEMPEHGSNGNEVDLDDRRD